MLANDNTFYGNVYLVILSFGEDNIWSLFPKRATWFDH